MGPGKPRIVTEVFITSRSCQASIGTRNYRARPANSGAGSSLGRCPGQPFLSRGKPLRAVEAVPCEDHRGGFQVRVGHLIHGRGQYGHRLVGAAELAEGGAEQQCGPRVEALPQCRFGQLPYPVAVVGVVRQSGRAQQQLGAALLLSAPAQAGVIVPQVHQAGIIMDDAAVFPPGPTVTASVCVPTAGERGRHRSVAPPFCPPRESRTPGVARPISTRMLGRLIVDLLTASANRPSSGRASGRPR
ncbi:hypothetical protein J5Y04_28705 [Kitasatospora sp. RG8]|uniref:hypothetical protein n=1 Tax=Kitasatospora sp. RG8 TaxID=2820815 RepID=UPI001ADFB501|nr:hypothetical protein [Kitasatospora sp. RG8]MBP0453494.1 hypothetical protein [Kitasatospora sp. RG8]